VCIALGDDDDTLYSTSSCTQPACPTHTARSFTLPPRPDCLPALRVAFTPASTTCSVLRTLFWFPFGRAFLVGLLLVSTAALYGAACGRSTTGRSTTPLLPLTRSGTARHGFACRAGSGALPQRSYLPTSPDARFPSAADHDNARAVRCRAAFFRERGRKEEGHAHAHTPHLPHTTAHTTHTHTHCHFPACHHCRTCTTLPACLHTATSLLHPTLAGFWLDCGWITFLGLICVLCAMCDVLYIY